MIRLLNAPLSWKPFPHICIEGWLEGDVYRELSMSRPDMSMMFCGAPPNTRHDLSSKVMLSQPRWLAPVWASFAAGCTSKAFWEWQYKLFKPAIDKFYPDLVLDAPQTNYVRGRADGPLELDCQMSFDTMPVVDGTVRGPHVDNPKELIGTMYYMPRHYGEGSCLGGDLLLYKYVKKPKVWGKAEIVQTCVKAVSRIEYKANTLVMFLNSMDSVHGVFPRQAGAPPRRMVNMVVEQPKKLFDPEEYRTKPRIKGQTSWGMPTDNRKVAA